MKRNMKNYFVRLMLLVLLGACAWTPLRPQWNISFSAEPTLASPTCGTGFRQEKVTARESISAAPTGELSKPELAAD
jgi:hypothetical protein